MTLDAAEVVQVTDIAARVAAEVARNMIRGTGGATLPLPVQRLGTVGGTVGAGQEVSVRADGDITAVPAINATGAVLEAGDRVVIEWRSPAGCNVTNLLSRAERGNWTPLITGSGSNNGSGVKVGHYTRHGHRVTVYGSWHFSGAVMGAPTTLTGLPFPVITDGDGIPAIIHGYANDTDIGRAHPIDWIIGEGASEGQVWWHNAFGGGAVLLSAVNATGPFTWATNDYMRVWGTYDTDAA